MGYHFGRYPALFYAAGSHGSKTSESLVHRFADHGGKVTHLSGTVQDITEQVKAHVKISESESLLRSAEEVGFTGSYEVDLVNKTCHFSDGLFRIFGEDPQSFDPTLEYIYAKTHPDDIARCRMIQEEAIAEKRAYHYICRIFRRDGEERAVELHGKVILDKNQRPFKLLAVVQDITDHRRHELELKSKNIEIQKRNEEVASFAFIASHDLREPTRKILAFSDFLMSKERENLSREGKDYMDRIDKAVKRLDILINDMLGLSQIHMAQQPREPVNLNSVLEEVKTEMREWMLAVDAVVEAEELPVIQGVRQQLIHLFQNILSNAFKFHKEDQAPRVRIKWEIQDADKFELENASPKRYLRLSFIDNGIGFHNRYNKKVFEIFQTLSIHGQGQGTGMGLTICRKVMENHNGFIVADSKENVGSTFCCYFPYEEN